MKTREARERWGEVLLGGLAGLGVPMVLWGVARHRGKSPGGPVTVGAVAGLVGALVSGRLARRTRGEASIKPAEATLADQVLPGGREERVEPMPAWEDAPEPRRGPSGRERHWYLRDAVAHTP